MWIGEGQSEDGDAKGEMFLLHLIVPVMEAEGAHSPICRALVERACGYATPGPTRGTEFD